MPRRSSGMSSGTKAILAILILIVIGYFAWQAGIFSQLGFQAAPPSGPSIPAPPGTSVPAGVYTMKVSAYDTLDVATSRTVGSDVNVYWYAYRNGGWVLLGSGNDAQIEIIEQDAGYIYMVCSSTSNYYVDSAKVSTC